VDSVGDYRMMKTFVDTYMKPRYAQKPTIAAVHGWCTPAAPTWCSAPT
jgi:enoyl-CoA hydratase